MAGKADSEEQLGEKAPAGVPAIDVDKQGIPERWGIDGDPGTRESMQEEGLDLEAGTETPPQTLVGGEPEVGETNTSPDEQQAA